MDENSTGHPVALVAGASRGLGLLIAIEIGRRGYDLALCSRSLESLERAREILAVQVPDATVFVAVENFFWISKPADSREYARSVSSKSSSPAAHSR